jgi:hypothetical protein
MDASASLSLPHKHLRRSIVDLKLHHPAEFGRFVMALQALEASDDWFRICGIHGNTFKPADAGVLCPTDPAVVETVAETGEPVYCKHSVYPFIAWHVPYIYQFELLLNKYNKSENKAYIALPYLDLTDFSQDLTFLNEDRITILFDGKEQTIANPFAAHNARFYDLSGNCVPVERKGYLTPTTEEQRLTLNTVRKQLFNTQFSKTYEEFSSKPVILPGAPGDDFVGTPLETPHNTCHDVIGGDGGNMSDISISAFDPIFWLHHCNMDRFYYNWMSTQTDGFTKSFVTIQDTTRAAGHAPFFPTGLFSTDPTTYGYGWTNGTGAYQILNDTLALGNFPYTYAPIAMPTMTPLAVSSYINLLGIPIPMETVVIKAYLVPKGTALNKETQFAGLVVWLGLNRAKRHCSRCERTRVNLQIDITEHCARYGIHAANADRYEIVLEGVGKLTSTEYKRDEIVLDGSMVVHIQ